MQGDACSLKLQILYEDNTVVSEDDIAEIEVKIGHLRKTYSDGDVVLDDGVWKIPLTQSETFRFPPTKAKIQVRIALPSGDVQGYQLGEIRFSESTSREVL